MAFEYTPTLHEGLNTLLDRQPVGVPAEPWAADACPMPAGRAQAIRDSDSVKAMVPRTADDRRATLAVADYVVGRQGVFRHPPISVAHDRGPMMGPYDRPSGRPLSQGSVDVWLSPSSPGSRMVQEACIALLHEDERRRWQRFLSTEAADQYLVARALLRTTLSRYWPIAPTEWRCETAEFGKPFIVHPSGITTGFNLSHTSGLVACAIHATQPVGIDVEKTDPRVDHRALSRMVLVPAERTRLDSLPASDQANDFFRYWTLKEAFIKANGLGLAMPLQSFALDLDVDPPAITLGTETYGKGWHFMEFVPMAGYRMALAVRLAEEQTMTCVVRWVELEAMVARS